ncbi:hypothetical protein AHF37_06799 [Paragonimus kellicotti]|nr:hypothetical protein AHF37_06799 [Paragonimus kellicotti]
MRRITAQQKDIRPAEDCFLKQTGTSQLEVRQPDGTRDGNNSPPVQKLLYQLSYGAMMKA